MAEYQTRQRAQILEVLRAQEGRHCTAEEVLSALRTRGHTVGKATVYRYLDKLVQEGLVQKYIGEGGACFQFIGEDTCREHFHLKCEQCGELVHLECHVLETLSAHLEEEHRCRVNRFRTVLYGLCPRCAKEDA